MKVKQHIRLARVGDKMCRVWTNSKGETFVLNVVGRVGDCLRG